jgi:hypothetical protein
MVSNAVRIQNVLCSKVCLSVCRSYFMRLLTSEEKMPQNCKAVISLSENVILSSLNHEQLEPHQHSCFLCLCNKTPSFFRVAY